MKILTYQQHICVLKKLVNIGETIDVKTLKSEDIAYESIMICFLLQELSIANSLIRLFDEKNAQYYPSTVGYILCRSMLELDINAHYVSRNSKTMAQKYINYKKLITKDRMDVCEKHRNSKKNDWNYALNVEWNEYWKVRKSNIDDEYLKVISEYTRTSKKGKSVIFSNWSGKNIREMAEIVDHQESYDYFYAFLSSFVHGDIEEIDRFLRIKNESLIWTIKTNEFDIGNVFRHAATFLHCFLGLFGKVFSIWDKSYVDECWNV